MFAVWAGRHSSPSRSALRIILLGLVIGAAWLVFSLFSGGPSASADDSQDEPLESLLGSVEGTVSTVTETVVEPVVEVVEPVVDAVEPVVDADDTMPQTEAEVDTVTETIPADAVVDVIDTAAVVVEDEPLTAVVTPVTGLLDNGVNQIVTAIPVVGEPLHEILGDAPTGDLIGTTVGGVDALLDQVVGPVADLATDSADVLVGTVDEDPELPTVSLVDAATPVVSEIAYTAPVPAPSDVLFETAHADDAVLDGASDASALFSSTGPAAPQPGVAFTGAGSAATGSGASGASSFFDAVSAASFPAGTGVLTPVTVGDDLPSSPVFGTDSTPD